MAEFHYQEILPLGKDRTKYKLLTEDHVSLTSFEKKEILKIAPEGLSLLAQHAIKDASHLMRSAHLKLLTKIFNDPESSDNDRYVALELLKNAVIASEGVFPMCQDTGTAIAMVLKGNRIWTPFSEHEAIARGIFNAYEKYNLRYSQNAPLTMYDEANTGTNLPAQIDIYPTTGEEYNLLFIAKGAGCSNKTFLYQATKPIFDFKILASFMKDKAKIMGTAACPPYHLAFVVGGISPEMNLKTVKLASAGYLDELPVNGNEHGQAFRDKVLEVLLLMISREQRVGAQFGGKYFCHDIRVIRLPRHGASCPVGVGLSCSAHRQIKTKITREGIFMEKLETDPAKYLPVPAWLDDRSVRVDLDRPMDELRETLGKYPISTKIMLNGKVIVARDMAHAKIKKRLDNGEELPQYLKDHIVYYAGPAKTPEGYASGSFGPTTGARMDPYVPLFQKHGGSLVMLAKGNRSKQVTESCKKHSGFYLGTIGGVAARIGKECITKVELVEYPELGMEAVFMITLKDFPAFILVDNKGNDFYEKVLDLPFAYSVMPHIT